MTAMALGTAGLVGTVVTRLLYKAMGDSERA